MITPGFINASRSAETKRVFDMVEDAKKLALSGSAMHAQMLMNLLKVPGGRETLWQLTSAKERRDIQYLARTYKPAAPNPFAV
jgi:hypothetical protein